MTPTQFVIFTIERLKARLRTNDLLTGLLGLLALVLVWLLTVVVVDQAVILPRGVRLVLVVVLGIVAALALVAVLAWPSMRRLNNLYVARMIETHDENRFRNSLTTFVELNADAAAPDDVRRAVAEKAARDLTELDVEALVSRRPLRWTVVVLATAGSILLAFGLLAPKSFSAGMARAIGAEVEPPTATRIVQLKPADGYRIVAGHAVTIELQLGGSLPDEASIDIEHTDGHGQRKPMRRIGDNTWEFTISDLLEDLRFSVRAGDARSPQHRLIVYPLPHVTAVACRLTRPAYTRREPQEVAGGNIDALPGTRVEITVLTSHPPEAPELRFDDGRKLSLRPLSDGSGARGEFVVGEAGGAGGAGGAETGYHISFRDKQMQLENRNPVQYRIRPLLDRLPLVELTPVGPAATQGPLDVPVNSPAVLHLRASDDYGLAGCWVDYYGLPADNADIAAAVAAGELSATMMEPLLRRTPLRTVALLPEPVPPAPAALRTSIDQPVQLTPASLGLRPGDAMLVRARAGDMAPGSAGLAGVSSAVLVRVLEPVGGQDTASDTGSTATGDPGDPGEGHASRGSDDSGNEAESPDPGKSGPERAAGAENGDAGGSSGVSSAQTGTSADDTTPAAASGSAEAAGDGGSTETASAAADAEGQGGPLDGLSPAEREQFDKLATALDKINPAATEGAEPTAEPGTESTDTAGGTGSTTGGTDGGQASTDPPRERPDAMDETGRNTGSSAEDPSLAASGQRIMRLANDLRIGQPVDPALLKELGWSEADLRQVVSNYTERYDKFAGGAGGTAGTGTGAVRVRPPDDNGGGRVVEGHGPLGVGGTQHRQADPGAGGTVVRPDDRPVSPEYAEIIEAYLRAVNQIQ